MNDILHDILAIRTSGVAIRLCDPAPDDATILRYLQYGMSAPDHGGLKPYRFSIMRGPDITKFAEHARHAKKLEQPDISDEALETLYQKPFRAPLIIACWSETQEHPSISADEQFATTAMAVEHMLIAAHAEKKWGAVLLSGWFASSPYMQQLFGLGEHDKMLGYIYMGAHVKEPRIRERPSVKDFIRPVAFSS